MEKEKRARVDSERKEIGGWRVLAATSHSPLTHYFILHQPV